MSVYFFVYNIHDAHSSCMPMCTGSILCFCILFFIIIIQDAEKNRLKEPSQDYTFSKLCVLEVLAMSSFLV